MRNARQLSFSQDEVKCLSNMLDESAPLNERVRSAEAVFLSISKQGKLIGVKHYDILHIDDVKEAFASVDSVSKISAVRSLISSINAVMNKVDLSMVGGSKFAGALQPNYSKLISDPEVDFVIVDQSVTGMFERRTRIGL